MTIDHSSAIVQRIWNYCNVLRDDGVSYGDYLEQLTYLLFLKMDDERASVGLSTTIPAAFSWQSLKHLEGAELDSHYREILTQLGGEKGMIGVIFRKAQNRINDPAKLRRLVHYIDGEIWMGLETDVKATIY